jgi:hypothetical protein
MKRNEFKCKRGEKFLILEPILQADFSRFCIISISFHPEPAPPPSGQKRDDTYIVPTLRWRKVNTFSNYHTKSIWPDVCQQSSRYTALLSPPQCYGFPLRAIPKRHPGARSGMAAGPALHGEITAPIWCFHQIGLTTASAKTGSGM